MCFRREELDAKHRESAAIEASRQKLEQQESNAQQLVDDLQQKAKDLKADADKYRELLREGDAEVKPQHDK